MHDYHTQFSDQEWAAILNHALNAGLTIDATVHRFVSAAPELLDALKGLTQVAVWDEDSDRPAFDTAIAAAKAAITKATGR